MPVGEYRYFNPLPPHGGRPYLVQNAYIVLTDFNPLPPHGGRHRLWRSGKKRLAISIHSLRMEGDHGFPEIS